jgi:hypothetical protein
LSEQIQIYLAGISLGEVVRNHKKNHSDAKVINFS